MRSFFVLIGTFFCLNMANAQQRLNDYKYVIVEKQFHFQNEPDEHNFNEMARFLFRKHGFTAIIEGEDLPADLKANFCLALKSEIIAKGALRTKATIYLRDCENNIVYQSKEGITREKEFKRAYDISIREAFKSFESITYKYKPNEDIIAKGRGEEETQEAEKAKKEIEELKAEIKELKEEKQDEPKDVVETPKEIQPTVEKEKPLDNETTKIKNEEDLNVLYAQKSKDGYHIVDGSTKVLMVLIATDLENVFIVKDENSIVYKKGDIWYYSKGENTASAIDIKF